MWSQAFVGEFSLDPKTFGGYLGVCRGSGDKAVTVAGSIPVTVRLTPYGREEPPTGKNKVV